MKASFILTAALTEWCFVQKQVNIFICLIALWGTLNSGEQSWEKFCVRIHSEARTTAALHAATAPELCNRTRDNGMGGTDARCILKIMLSHWTLSEGSHFCHELCIYADMGQENGFLERAPVVPCSKIYSKGEMKRTALSFSWCTAVRWSGETLCETGL